MSNRQERKNRKNRKNRKAKKFNGIGMPIYEGSEIVGFEAMRLPDGLKAVNVSGDDANPLIMIGNETDSSFDDEVQAWKDEYNNG